MNLLAFPNLRLSAGAEPLGPIWLQPLTEGELDRARSEGHPAWEKWGQDHVRAALENTRFKGRARERVSITSGDGVLWLVGRGKQGGTASLRRAVAVGMTLLADGRDWTLVLPEAADEAALQTSVRAAAEGAHLADYRFKITAGEDARRRRPGPGRLWTQGSTAAADRGLARAEALAAGMVRARDLVNLPAGDLGPEELAGEARGVADRHGWSSTTWTGDEVHAQGFRMVHAVGRASSRPPTFTAVRVGDPGAAPEVALVGKGVVFDSGGLNLKSSGGMLLMRKDMGGAGTVVGILETLGRLGFDRPLLAVIPAAENSVGPDSYRPGDILRAYDGKTVEIGNTDAEGRLLLADALAWAREQGARRMIDMATLTGAARVALGPDLPAMYGTDEVLARTLLEQSRAYDEPVWRMPLVKDYDAMLDTPFADVNHIASDRRGGSITAALFLRRFVGAVPWAHLDMYGWEDKGKPEAPKGGNGAMVRTVVGTVEALVGDS